MFGRRRMKKKKTVVHRLLLVSLLVVVAGLALVALSDRTPAAQARYEVELQAPPFLEEQNTEDDLQQFDIGEYLDDEAGISAWYGPTSAIDLNVVRSQFQVIELETADYIIGSVSVPGYNDYWDPHVYVHTDGWILAYYLNTELTGRIVDVLGQTIDSTLLENTVATIAGVAGVPYTGATLYDFRYPSATHMLFVAEDGADGTIYTIQMPTSYAYMERGWAKWNSNGYCTFTIDGVQLEVVVKNSRMCIGPVTYAQLDPGVTHVVDVDYIGGDYGVLTVTYAVP
jgi:hypothetical protein